MQQRRLAAQQPWAAAAEFDFDVLDSESTPDTADAPEAAQHPRLLQQLLSMPDGDLREAVSAHLLDLVTQRHIEVQPDGTLSITQEGYRAQPGDSAGQTVSSIVWKLVERDAADKPMCAAHPEVADSSASGLAAIIEEAAGDDGNRGASISSSTGHSLQGNYQLSTERGYDPEGQPELADASTADEVEGFAKDDDSTLYIQVFRFGSLQFAPTLLAAGLLTLGLTAMTTLPARKFTAF